MDVCLQGSFNFSYLFSDLIIFRHSGQLLHYQRTPIQHNGDDEQDMYVMTNINDDNCYGEHSRHIQDYMLYSLLHAGNPASPTAVSLHPSFVHHTMH